MPTSPIVSFITSRFGLLGLSPWLAYFALSFSIKRYFRSLKDPSQYIGVCYKSSGYPVDCSLENWLVWDASPYIDLYHFAGGLIAAALTGYAFLAFLNSRRDV